MEAKIPRISFEDVDNLGIATKKVIRREGVLYITRVSFDVETLPLQIARLLYFTRQKPPINVVFETPQAEFDLTMTPVNISTGEIATDQLAERL